MAAADAGGFPVVFLEGDPGFYGRLGWQRASEHGFAPPSTRIPDAGFQVTVLAAWQPWMTGALVYNDTFWTHDSVGLRATDWPRGYLNRLRAITMRLIWLVPS